jgi:hypothetical protein
MKATNFIKSATKRIKNHSLYLKNQVKQSKDFSEWNLKELLPASTGLKKLQKMSRKDAEKYLFARIEKKQQKEIQEITDKVNRIFLAGEITKITISVEWKKSATWGTNPTAECRIHTSNGYEFLTGKASGCGYDKESAAIASALNQSTAIIKMLFDADKKDPESKVYGYRSAKDGFFPHISGGVGVSCYRSVFALFGLNFECISYGKTYDSYLITKL